MKNNGTYRSIDISHLKTTTNYALARVKEAREEYRRCFPRVLYSLAAFLAGAAMLSGGVTLSVTTKNEYKSSSSYVSYVDDNFIEENLKMGAQNPNFQSEASNYHNDAGYVCGVVLETVGSITTLAGIIMLYKSLKQRSKEKTLYDSDVDMICKLLLYDNEFSNYLHNFDLEREGFSKLSIKEKQQVIESFVDCYDKQINSSYEMQK